MRTVMFLGAVACLFAIAAAQPTDLADLQFPDYMATFDAGLPIASTGTNSPATSVAQVAGQLSALTGAQGVCFVNVDDTTGITTVNITYQGIAAGQLDYQGGLGAAHLHGTGATQTTADPFLTSEGPMIFVSTYSNVTAACWTNFPANTPSGDCGLLAGQGVLTSQQRTQLENPSQYNMNWYCNVHTLTNQNGELRGQIYEPTNRYMAACDGLQSGAGSGTSGACVAWCTLDETAGVTCGGIYWGLGSTVTAAHVHLPGPQGAGSPPWIVFPVPNAGLPPQYGILASTNKASVANAATNNFDPIVAIRADWAYVNVHTTNYGLGEVRGQLHMVNSDPVFAPAAITGTNYLTGTCQAAVGMGAGMYWMGCASINGNWTLSENMALYSDSACTTLVSAVNRWSTVYNNGVHKLWPGMDVTRHVPMQVTAITNQASDITAWQASCACGGTWAINTPRTLTPATCTSGCTFLNTNWHAGVFNSTGFWFSPGNSWSTAQQVLVNSNVTTPTSWLNSYKTAATTVTACTDYTTSTYFHSGASAVAPASVAVLALAAVVAFFAAKDV